ncbi:MAG TPA: UPF0182 family protein [Frankiaceae bacterium]|nr:UPF0182 family protein [Frankiaceae bacterium]
MATPALSPRTSLLGRIVAVLAVAIVLLFVFTHLYTDRLWFGEVGFTGVFDTVLRTRILLFAVFGTLMALTVATNLSVAYRLRPPFRPASLEQRNLDRYRALVDPVHRPAIAVISLVAGVLAGIAASARWQTWLQWRNGVRFGVDDPQFGRDISYFAFTYPFQRLVVGFLFAALTLAILLSAATHYLYGGIRLQTRGERVLASARVHLSVLLGLFVLLKAYAYYLDQFGLAFSPRGKVTGASYTDVNAQLPALRILALIAVICALLFLATLFRSGWVLPGTGLGLMLASSLVVGGVYPLAVQQLQVKPNEIQREAPYIARNIAATQAAYRLKTGSDVTYTRYDARLTVPAAQLRNDRDTIANARLLDPNKLRDAWESLQQIRGYYGFPDTLDIDRYNVAGKTVTYVVGAREIDHAGLAPNQRNWINEHLVFTHGNGLVAAPTNVVDPQGQPRFDVRDIPPVGTIPISEPRIYYGERAPAYSVVATSQKEVDRPAEAGNDTVSTYEGKGGVGIGSMPRRLLFSLRFRSRYLLLSGALEPRSRILYVREPRDRVRKVAPYLELDQDPYPAVVDGRIVWIVDGYTTSNGYPYSERVDLNDLTADSVTARQTARQINYIRNSVKATVDAYDGTVTLYRWDEQDPVLRVWEKAFPGSLRPRSAMSPDLLAHVRYPEDLFKIQRDLIASYHIEDPAAFFREADFWAVPGDPSVRRDAAANAETLPPQPPYYVYAKLPGQAAPAFQLTSPLTARNRPNMAAFVTVSNEPETFGTINVLELPTNTAVPGPVQRGSTFQAETRASQELALLDQRGSEVVLGNLLTLPVGGTFVFVQPVYVQATQTGARIPELKKVFVGFGDKIGFADTFEAALDQAIRGDGATPPDGKPPTTETRDAAVARLSAEAQDAFKKAAEAFGRQDYTEYARQQDRLRRALDELNKLTGASPSASPTASPTPR